LAKLRELNYKELTTRLKKFGFVYYRSGKGSHELWVRNSDGKAVPVPHYRGKNIRKGTVRAIIREIEVSVEEFFG
jgi:predicted RNA binding protein YcfA (HicA-like mRNA interferase family)